MGGKWLQTLKEIAPHLTQVGVLRFAGTQVRILRSIEDNAASSGIKVVDCPVHDGPENGRRSVLSTASPVPA